MDNPPALALRNGIKVNMKLKNFCFCVCDGQFSLEHLQQQNAYCLM